MVAPAVERMLQRDFGGFEPATATATRGVRMIAERYWLDTQFRGDPVAVFRTRAGTLAVLAAGEWEIMALLKSLTPEEHSKVLVTDTDWC